MKWPARVLLRSTWARLDLACANSAADAKRLAELGVDARVVQMTGDPAVDSAMLRATTADPEASYLAPFHGDPRPTIVAGSTWQADEAILLTALRRTRDSVPGLLAVIAPHEPDRRHVASLMDRLHEDAWRAATLTEIESRESVADVDAVVVDRVGVLAHLYSVASVSYVGGGFHDAGLHSILEPASAGIPIVFGPRHHNTRAAGDLIAGGGAKIAKDADDRYPNASQFGQDLAAVLHDQAVNAKPYHYTFDQSEIDATRPRSILGLSIGAQVIGILLILLGVVQGSFVFELSTDSEVAPDWGEDEQH